MHKSVFTFGSGLEGNLGKLAIWFITNKRTYATFLTIFLLTMPGATPKTIGALSLISWISGFFLEIPSGYFADRIGHRKTLIIGRWAMVLSTLCYVLADGIWWFFLGALLLSIGYACSSGTLTAFAHDTLRAINRDHEYAEIIGKIRSLGFFIPVFFIILLPVLAESSYKLAFFVALGLDLIGLVATMLLKAPPTEETVKEIGIANFKSSLKEWMSIGWAKYIIIYGLTFGLVMGATYGFKDPYQQVLGFSLSMLGVLWAISRLLISGVLLINGWVVKHFTFKQFTILRTAAFAIIFVLVGFVINQWIVAGLFILSTALMWGLSSASSQYELTYIKNSSSKATLLSVNELLNKVTTALIGFGMGFLVADFSFQTAFLVVGIGLALLSFSALFTLKSSPQF